MSSLTFRNVYAWAGDQRKCTVGRLSEIVVQAIPPPMIMMSTSENHGLAMLSAYPQADVVHAQTSATTTTTAMRLVRNDD